MHNLILLDEKLKVCHICENKNVDWTCKGNGSIFNLQNCPKEKWDTIVVDNNKQISIKELSMKNIKTSLSLKPHKKLLDSKTDVEKIIYCAENYPPGDWPADFEKWKNTQQAFRLLAGKDALRIQGLEYPRKRFAGKGIVFCGGGTKYFPSLYVNIRMLRLLGCELPIEVFYLGVHEMDDSMLKLLEDIKDVKCINGRELENKFPIRIHGGWEAKVYAILNCSFEEVLFLDADNTALDNPIHLFYEYEYDRTGAILWPDYECWRHDANMWNILGIEFREEPQVESGQVLVNKSKCWKELNMAKHYCDFSDYYFKLFYGDKEAFHFGWKFFGSEYGSPPPPDWINNCVIVQKNFDSSWLFSHRAQAKFKLDKSHNKAFEIPYENDTLELIDELNLLWSGEIWTNKEPNEEESLLIKKLSNKKYDYIRVGIDKRTIELLPENKIGEGSARLEKTWHIFKKDGLFKMSISGEEGLLVLLELDEKTDIWNGKWFNYEKCEINLILCTK